MSFLSYSPTAAACACLHPCRCACVMSRHHMCAYECTDRLLIDFIPTSKNATIKYSIHRHHAQTCDILVHRKQPSNVYAWEISPTPYAVCANQTMIVFILYAPSQRFSLGIGLGDCIVCIHFAPNSIRVFSLQKERLRISHLRCMQQWLSHFATAPH